MNVLSLTLGKSQKIAHQKYILESIFNKNYSMSKCYQSKKDDSPFKTLYSLIQIKIKIKNLA